MRGQLHLVCARKVIAISCVPVPHFVHFCHLIVSLSCRGNHASQKNLNCAWHLCCRPESAGKRDCRGSEHEPFPRFLGCAVCWAAGQFSLRNHMILFIRAQVVLVVGRKSSIPREEWGNGSQIPWLLPVKCFKLTIIP